jgi:hypothetical protein
MKDEFLAQKEDGAARERCGISLPSMNANGECSMNRNDQRKTVKAK